VAAVSQRESPRNSRPAHSVREISDNWGVSKGVVLNLIKSKKLKAKRVSPGRLIILDEDLAEYLKEAQA
jgi:hypothetical protein